MPSDPTAATLARHPTASPVALGTIVVTGGASGLGRAVAAAVASRGGTPVVLDRATPRDSHEHELVDLADGAAAEAAVQRVADRHDDLHGIVTAAGIDACGRLSDVDRDAWERVIAVNLLGTVAIVRAALPHLARTNGRVVTVASTLGWRALSDATAYCASKFGVVGFTRALMAEVGDEVGVTLLLPGGMQTPFFDDRPEQYRPGADAVLAPPEEIAEAALFALTRPPGVDVREMMVSVATEPSWP
ncbi:MAG TPA: SDR family oxidoreductase [Baekduia sp.]|uniref:SDR family oxidoreductase n=1 Tax=Baekduia sp. TaxID=2600305 RepID=UPI002B5A985A|nr:SDR family oxidoreductase [Baekduia sp.]HMJ35058.1 SDR family oxidoreductase [Baekduia sp.]